MHHARATGKQSRVLVRSRSWESWGHGIMGIMGIMGSLTVRGFKASCIWCVHASHHHTRERLHLRFHEEAKASRMRTRRASRLLARDVLARTACVSRDTGRRWRETRARERCRRGETAVGAREARPRFTATCNEKTREPRTARPARTPKRATTRGRRALTADCRTKKKPLFIPLLYKKNTARCKPE